MAHSTQAVPSGRARILVVEDEGIVGAHIAAQLSKEGYEVAGIAESSEEAFAKAGDLKPQLVLMDIRIKGPVDGITTAKLLRERYDIPVIYLTAHTDRETVDRAKTAGASYFLTKPTNQNSLRISIEMAMHGHLAEQEIRRQRGWLETVLETMADAMIVVDRQGSVRFLNAPAAALTGWSSHDALGRCIAEVLPMQDGASRFEPQFTFSPGSEAALPREIPHGTTAADRSGRKFPIEGEIALSLNASEMVGAIITFRDQTSRLAREAEKRHEYKMEAVGRLAAGVAHDFNNLLFIILGYTEGLMDPPRLGEAERESLTAIQQAAYSAAAITRQLVQFSRNDSAEKKDVPINDLVRDSDQHCRELAGPTVRWLFNCHPDAGSVQADPAQLKLLLTNLVTNARDAMPGGGRITLETSNVDLPRESAGEIVRERFVALSVRDTGAGMAPEIAERLFEPFFTTKLLGRGTGLGLSIVHSIVRDLGGSIQVESQPGRGSAFTLYLPRTGDGDAAASTTVLIAEDNEVVRSLLRHYLGSAGYRLLEAEDGEAALRLANECKGPIDLLVTDIMMPKVGGFELAHTLSARREFGTIFISGCSDAFWKDKQQVPDGARFLQKPFLREDLLNQVNELLHARERAAKSQSA